MKVLRYGLSVWPLGAKLSGKKLRSAQQILPIELKRAGHFLFQDYPNYLC